MKKFLKVTISIIALLLIVVVVGVGSLVYFIDPNKMRPVIVEEVMNRTGYQLAIYGKLKWRIFPVMGLNVARMTLTSPNQTEPFVDLHNVTISSDVSRLIHGDRRLEGDVRIGNVKLVNIEAQNARVILQWQENVLTLSPISAFLYGGTLEGVAHGRNLNRVPTWDWDLKLNDVQLKPLIHDANKGNTKLNITGKGTVAIKASTEGISREQIITNLNGVTKFSVDNGSVQGIDLNYLLASADALLSRHEVSPPTGDVRQTEFNALTGTVNVKNGVASSNDLLLTAPAFTTKAEGTINLLYQAINFALQVQPSSEAQKKWEIPVLVTGNLKEPDVRLDLNELQRYIAKSQVDKVKQKLNDEISRRLPDGAGEAIQNLLGG